MFNSFPRTSFFLCCFQKFTVTTPQGWSNQTSDLLKFQFFCPVCLILRFFHSVSVQWTDLNPLKSLWTLPLLKLKERPHNQNYFQTLSISGDQSKENEIRPAFCPNLAVSPLLHVWSSNRKSSCVALLTDRRSSTTGTLTRKMFDPPYQKSIRVFQIFLGKDLSRKLSLKSTNPEGIRIQENHFPEYVSIRRPLETPFLLTL